MHQTSQRPHQRPAPPIAYVIVSILAIVALCICATSLYGQQTTLFLRNLEPSCIVETGSATITVQAWSANDDCSSMVAGHDDFTGVNWGRLLSPASEADGSVICEKDINGRHLIVKDSNPFSDTGAVFCGMIDHVA